MELRNLYTFSKVCETMNFSRAAEELGYAQSTVTAQVAQLEEELGVSLFDRSGKRFRLNDKGAELLAYANRITALAQEAQSVISNDQTPRGVLRLGTIDSLVIAFLPEILEEYLLEYPQVKVQVVTGSTRELREMLGQGRIDLLLTLDEPLRDPDWEVAWQREEELLFLCGPRHPFAGREVTMEELTGENLLLTEEKCNYRGALESACSLCGLPVRSSLEMGNTTMLLNCAEKNMGVALLPHLIARQRLEEGRLCSFSVRGFELKLWVQLAYRQSKWCSPAMKMFVDKVRSGEGKSE